MKTKRIVAKKSSPVPLIMAAVLGLTSFSCSESWIPCDPCEEPKNNFSGILSEDFRVDREGRIVYALEGAVVLEFPEDAVTEPTLFTLELVPLNHLEMSGYNMMNCGISLESASRKHKFEKSVLIKLNYCITDFKAGNPVDEENITIYSIIPNVSAHSIGECSVDETWDVINGCITECGFYVVGEN